MSEASWFGNVQDVTFISLVQSLSPVQLFAKALSYEIIFYFIFNECFFFSSFPSNLLLRARKAEGDCLNSMPGNDDGQYPFVLSVQSLSRVRLFAIPSIAAHQASLSITNSLSLIKLMSIESVMPSDHLVLCHPLLLPLTIFPSIRVFSNESVPRIR